MRNNFLTNNFEHPRYRLLRLCRQLLLVLACYSICRILFVAINHDELNISLAAIPEVFIGGLRFDFSAVMATNVLFIVLTLFPFPALTLRNVFQKIYNVLFIAVNSICLVVNISDIAYFPFVHKRSQADMLLYLNGQKGNDFFRLLPHFFIQYWYLLVVVIAMLIFFLKVYKRTLIFGESISLTWKRFSLSLLALLVSIGICVLGIRGGIQAKPLNLIHASEMTEVQNIPAILNTPFSMIKTFGKKSVADVHYFSDTELQLVNYGVQHPNVTQPFKKDNVVIIIVESLSKKFPSFFGGRAQTPFLDSLLGESAVFVNSYANAKESVQGIPAILSSIPSWQDDPFIFSNFSSNKITSLANILNEEGYATSFFHGGFNGTMGFDSYSKLSGFQKYYGKNEFGNDEENYCNWGVWDEPFLQFMAKKLSEETQPFLSAVFTLNTHDPYDIPEKYKEQFAQKGHPIFSCLRYMDYSLARFFETIKKEPWFNNTVFVITADHAAPFETEGPSNSIEDYKIPIAFYKPGSDLKGKLPEIANQIDIMPSVLHLLNYKKDFYSLGKNLFEKNPDRFSISYCNGIYQYVDALHCYQFNGQDPVAFYNSGSDSSLQHNLYHGAMASEMKMCDHNLKMNIQLFNQCLIHNRMHIHSPGIRSFHD